MRAEKQAEPVTGIPPDGEEWRTLQLKVQEYCQAGLNDTQQLKLRWDEQEILYNNQERFDDSGTISQLQMPVVHTMTKHIIANVVNAILSQEPVLTVDTWGPTSELRATLEDIFRFMFARTRPRIWMRKMVKRMVLQHQVVGRVVWLPRELGGPGPQVRIADNRQVIVVPNHPGNIAFKKLVLERFPRTREMVEKLMEEGWYRKVPLTGQSGNLGPLDKNAELSVYDKTGATPGIPQESETIYIWDGIMRYTPAGTGKQQLFVITVLDNTWDILRFLPYPYPIHQWFSGTFEVEEDTFWVPSSLATVLQPYQVEASQLTNIGLDTAMLAARPPLQRKGYTRSTVANQEYMPGYVYDMDGDIVPMVQGADPRPVFMAREGVWNMAERVSMVNDLRMGQALPEADTLGEVRIAEVRNDIAFDDAYIGGASQTVADIAEIMRWLLHYHWDDYVDVYGDALPDGATGWMLSGAFDIRVTGQSLSTTPQARRNEVISVLKAFTLGPLAPFADQYEIAKQFVQTVAIPNRERLLVSPEQADMIRQRLAQAAAGAPPSEMGMMPGAEMGMMPGATNGAG